MKYLHFKDIQAEANLDNFIGLEFGLYYNRADSEVYSPTINYSGCDEGGYTNGIITAIVPRLSAAKTVIIGFIVEFIDDKGIKFKHEIYNPENSQFGFVLKVV